MLPWRVSIAVRSRHSGIGRGTTRFPETQRDGGASEQVAKMEELHGIWLRTGRHIADVFVSTTRKDFRGRDINHDQLDNLAADRMAVGSQLETRTSNF